MRNFLTLVLSIALLLSQNHAAAKATVLDYAPSDIKSVAQFALPESAFHDWTQAQAEANIVLKAWEAEPASLAWTRIQLARHIKHKTMPTRGARGLALMHVAMHDAYQLAITAGKGTEVARLAMSMAAAELLGYLYTAEERAFVRIAFEIAAASAKTDRERLPLDALAAFALGAAVAAKVIRHAENDGAQRGWNGSRLQYYGQDRYYGPGSWEPTPPYFYYPPDEPFAPNWRTWTLKSVSQFRPVPPQFGSARYLVDLNEVVRINNEILATAEASKAAPSNNSVQGATLPTPQALPTDERYRIAMFWVDGYGSVTPPGHWNQIAIESVLRANLDDKKTLELFAQINIGMADTFVATWDAKYYYWTMRPITAAKKLLNLELKPIVLTPPFPSYPSGHAAFSACAAHVLSQYFPSEKKELMKMAQEAAMSRLYGGIHFRFDDDDGLQLGIKVANATITWFSSRLMAF
jgi:hypothetical protein